MKRYLFDTNALNAFLDRGIRAGDLVSDHQYCVTAAQVGELKATRHASRRLELLEHFTVMAAEAPISRSSLRSGPFGTSPFGHTPFGGGDGEYFSDIKTELDSMPKNRNRRGNTADALTLEVCIYEEAILVTDDPSLITSARSRGVEVVGVGKFLEMEAGANGGA